MCRQESAIYPKRKVPKMCTGIIRLYTDVYQTICIYRKRIYWYMKVNFTQGRN